MARLKVNDKSKVEKVIKNLNLINIINDHLKKNDLDGFEIESIKIKSKESAALGLVCPKNYHLEEIVTASGTIKQVCVKD